MSLEQVALLGPVATGVVALVALVVGVVTIVQRAQADRRDQWWKRAQWALDLSLEDDAPRAAVGLAVLVYLADSGLAGREEARLLRAVRSRDVDKEEPLQDDGTDEYELIDPEEDSDGRGTG